MIVHSEIPRNWICIYAKKRIHYQRSTRDTQLQHISRARANFVILSNSVLTNFLLSSNGLVRYYCFSFKELIFFYYRRLFIFPIMSSHSNILKQSCRTNTRKNYEEVLP